MERRGAASFGLLALLLVLALQVSVVDPGHGPHDVHLVQTLYPEHMVDKASQYGFGYGKPGVGYAIVKAVCVARLMRRAQDAEQCHFGYQRIPVEREGLRRCRHAQRQLLQRTGASCCRERTVMKRQFCIPGSIMLYRTWDLSTSNRHPPLSPPMTLLTFFAIANLRLMPSTRATALESRHAHLAETAT